MVRRGRRAPAGAQDRAALDILASVASVAHADWGDCLRRGHPGRLGSERLSAMTGYFDNVLHHARLFIPARDPGYGISERGGDAILGYLTNGDNSGSYLFFADVSGFTALLTFLTERFGKEEAGDIMNLGILNRFCLNKMGLVLDHFSSEGREGDRGVAALKVMLAIRASMPLVTIEVRAELTRKLAGKPHQDEIESFISALVVRASGGLVFDPEPGSGFYGSRVRSRITWGRTGVLVARAEKIGGDDELVADGVEEVKGIGLDSRCCAKLDELLGERWLGLGPGDLALGPERDGFRKLVIRPSGMARLSGFVEELCNGVQAEARRAQGVGNGADAAERIIRAGRGLLEVEPYIGGRPLLMHIVRSLGPDGANNLLLDEACSAVRDSGILFCNFEIPGPGVLDELADSVQGVMARYGIHYKYNIFPKGDFNLMGVLGTAFSTRRGSDKYYAEILWNAWRDLDRAMGGAFGGEVRIRGGMSVGKGLQGPAGDNIINNEETIIGPDCNLAARLVNEALETGPDGSFVHPSGTLFTIGSHRRKLEHLIQPMPPVREAALKGFSAPAALYSLVERREVEGIREFIARMRKYPLVTEQGQIIRGSAELGKSRVLSEAAGMLERAAGGEHEKPLLFTFIAPSGVGKTRRMAELANWALERDWPVYFGECYSWYQDSGAPAAEEKTEEAHSDEGAYPFFPFIRILKEQVFRIDNQDPPERKREKIAEVLAALDDSDPELMQQAPVVAYFLGLDVPETGFSAALDAEARRNIFYERVGDIFAQQARRAWPGGLVMVYIDDLQWSDRNTLHLLSYLLRRIRGGLVVCVNARRPSQLGVLRDKDLPVERRLFRPGLLRQDAVARLARLVLGLRPDAEIPSSLQERLEKELERNPFFVIEFCSKLLEQETVNVTDGRITRMEDDVLRNLTIPTRIQGVIEDRISRLSPEEHAAIRYSSVLGNILRYIIVRRFLPAVDRERLFENESLEEIFTRLTGQEITRLENEKDPEWVYTFRRALIGEKLYQELVPSLRKRLHREVARVFENTELANRFEKALLTALHYSNAEVPDKSCSYYLEAGRLAREVFDNEKSLMLLEKIDRILSEYRVSDKTGRRLEMLEDRGEVNLLLCNYDSALEDFGELATLARKREDRNLESAALNALGRTYFQRSTEGDFDRAIESFRGAAAVAVDQFTVARISNDRARAHLEKGETDEALEQLDLAGQSYGRSLDGAEPGVKQRVFEASLLRNRGSVYHRRGEFDTALEIYGRALELVVDEQEPRFRKIRSMLLNSVGLSHMKAFRLERSLEYFRPALALARSIGDLKTEIQVRINIGVVDNDMGRNREALETLTEQHDTLEMLLGETRELAVLEFNIGESYMFMEDYAAAEPWYRRALELGRRIGYREFEAATRCNLGEMLHLTGRDSAAAEVLEPALEMTEKGGWKLQLMDLCNLLGEIRRAEGDFAEALGFHERALELSGELGDDFGRSWSLRNLALDRLEDPEMEDRAGPECGELLEQSLALARSAGQPENLMHSLRALIRWRIRGNGREQALPLLDELEKLAREAGSETFLRFCGEARSRAGETP